MEMHMNDIGYAKVSAAINSPEKALSLIENGPAQVSQRRIKTNCVIAMDEGVRASDGSACCSMAQG
jgi:hypothetical protein